MPTNKRLAGYLATGAAVSAIAVAAGVVASNSSDAAKPAATSSLITTRTTSAGEILIDGRGRTVYLFAQDTGSPTCAGTCASYWPPVPATPAKRAGGDAAAADVSSVAAPGGGRQLTYAGHPLYYFVGDRKPGDANGQDLDQFGAKWYVLDPAGAAVTKSIKAARNASGGGYGY